MEPLWGADRVIIYLEPAKATLDVLDGSQEQAIRRSVEKFLESPQSAFAKSVASHLWQTRDLGTSTRAFSAWGQNSELSREACFVLQIYRKKNEDQYFAQKNPYNRNAKAYSEKFAELGNPGYDEWIAGLRNEPELLIVD